MGNIFNQDSQEFLNENAIQTVFEGIPMKIIDLNDLRTNKKISGRSKDLNDLENLSEL